jgi:hypothetical protein
LIRQLATTHFGLQRARVTAEPEGLQLAHSSSATCVFLPPTSGNQSICSVTRLSPGAIGVDRLGLEQQSVHIENDGLRGCGPRSWSCCDPRRRVEEVLRHHVRPMTFLIAASNCWSFKLRRAPRIISASRPTGTRSGVAGSSIALAIARPTRSGPGRPSGPVILASVPVHCSQRPG